MHRRTPKGKPWLCQALVSCFIANAMSTAPAIVSSAESNAFRAGVRTALLRVHRGFNRDDVNPFLRHHRRHGLGTHLPVCARREFC